MAAKHNTNPAGQRRSYPRITPHSLHNGIKATAERSALRPYLRGIHFRKPPKLSRDKKTSTCRNNFIFEMHGTEQFQPHRILIESTGANKITIVGWEVPTHLQNGAFRTQSDNRSTDRTCGLPLLCYPCKRCSPVEGLMRGSARQAHFDLCGVQRDFFRWPGDDALGMPRHLGSGRHH